jgi:hypothetical protein
MDEAYNLPEPFVGLTLHSYDPKVNWWNGEIAALGY